MDRLVAFAAATLVTDCMKLHTATTAVDFHYQLEYVSPPTKAAIQNSNEHR